jgi:hypothetical protein
MENFDNKFRKKIERGEGASFEHPNVEGISDELLQHLSYSLGRMWCSEADKEKVESMIADSSKIEKSIKLILSEKMAESIEKAGPDCIVGMLEFAKEKGYELDLAIIANWITKRIEQLQKEEDGDVELIRGFLDLKKEIMDGKFDL